MNYATQGEGAPAFAPTHTHPRTGARNRRLALCICVLLLAHPLAPSQPQPATQSGERKVDVPTLLKEDTSLASALVQVAGARFAANEKRGTLWIMTLHDASTNFGVLKYADRRATVVALPIIRSGDEYGLRHYVEAYNRLDVKSADLKVKAGKYSEAEEIYRLLLHFEPDSSLAPGVSQRLGYLEKILKGVDVAQNLRNLMDLYSDISPGFLTGMDDAPPVAVTNLFQIRFQ